MSSKPKEIPDDKPMDQRENSARRPLNTTGKIDIIRFTVHEYGIVLLRLLSVLCALKRSHTILVRAVENINHKLRFDRLLKTFGNKIAV